ncbi:MAG: ethanolamine permease [Rudanella sp.]|nr:ethanolamine permease [Rudanella sp.]
MTANPSLRKVINTTQLWGIAVGMVISGEYFGWNYGLGVAGTVGFIIATLLVSVFYVAFIFSFTELTASMPDAGGPFTYATRAFGPKVGFLAGFSSIIGILMAPPAIAAALGAYAHFLHPGIPAIWVADGAYFVFVAINILGIKESANLSVVITALSVVELVIFMGLVSPAYETQNLLAHNSEIRSSGIFAAIPFAIWFYIGIEGVAMVAEEVRDPIRTIPRGYLLSIGTLVVLALGTMILSAGAGDWRQITTSDYPLPATLAMVLGPNSGWARLFAGLGLFGLIASFHGTTIGYSRQIYAMARDGYLPRWLGTVNPRFRTPHWSLVAGGVVGLLALFSGTTDKIITLSALGTVAMYLISLVCLFALRQREPDMERPFRVAFYPFLPGLALVLGTICLLAMIYFNPLLSLIFAGLMAGAYGVFLWIGPKDQRNAVN